MTLQSDKLQSPSLEIQFLLIFQYCRARGKRFVWKCKKDFILGLQLLCHLQASVLLNVHYLLMIADACAETCFTRACQQHMLKQWQCVRHSIMPLSHEVDEVLYLLRRLPASWPLSLDQPILLLPCLIDILLFLSLQKNIYLNMQFVKNLQK